MGGLPRRSEKSYPASVRWDDGHAISYGALAAAAMAGATAQGFTLDELRGFLADKLGRHELPVALEFRVALPRTTVGKRSRKELAQRH